MDAIQHIRECLVREQFPLITDLHDQPHVTPWSDHHLITQQLLDALPFGRAFSPTTFYHLTDHELAEVVEEASQTLLFWTLSGAQHFDGRPAENLTLFYDDVFFWQYYVPAQRETIIQSLRNRNRIRFLSRFCLSKTQIELAFNEIRIQENGTEEQLVYTDSKELTYEWQTRVWETTILNHDLGFLNPAIAVHPPDTAPATDRISDYQAHLPRVLRHTGDLQITDQYWASVDSTTADSTPPPGLDSEPIPRNQFPLNFNNCGCGIDVCSCDIRYPGTPRTPPGLELWDPRTIIRPLDGIHYNRHTGF